jgi:ADP-dependent NAD(P)H-hydrate dehydratase / NAD(P)H-hydrate epimerase
VVETGARTISLKALETLRDLAARRDAVTLGPGLGLDEETQALARTLVFECPQPMVVDADALTALTGHLDRLRGAAGPRCLTPHPGEMARMLGVSVADVQRDRIATARRFATTHAVSVVLKGASSVVGLPDGTVLLNSTGNPGMASGGTGDVLSGVLGAFLARGLAAEAALPAAVYLHGLAGDVAAERVGQESLVAGDVIEALPEAFRRVGVRD